MRWVFRGALITKELDCKTWVTPKYPFKPKSIKRAKQEYIVRPSRYINEITSINSIVEEDVPNYKNQHVVHKELLVTFGLEENRLSREQIRTLNIMIDFYQWRNSYKNQARTKYFYILYSGYNVYFISYENEFYGVAKLDWYYIYKIIEEMVVCIGVSTKLESVDQQIDKYLCERVA